MTQQGILCEYCIKLGGRYSAESSKYVIQANNLPLALCSICYGWNASPALISKEEYLRRKKLGVFG